MSWVKDFGAVGDGSADDTHALEHAVETGDGVLELSRGTYKITSPIFIDLTQRGFTGIRGDQGTARVLMAGPGPAFRIVGDHQGTADPWTVKDRTWDKERFPVVSGIEIVGAHEEAVGIELFRTLQTTIHSVAIRNCKHGIRLVERNRNFILSNSHLYHNTDTGLFFDNCNLHQTNILGNHISYNARAGIRQWNGDVHNIQIVGNDIEYNSGEHEISGEIVLEAPDGVISEFTIASNTLQATADAKGANVLILGKDDELPHSVRVITITGNVIGSRDKNILIRNGQRIVISGNSVYSGTALNLHLSNCLHSTISANTIVSRPSGYKAESKDGILLERCVACSITSCILNDSALGEEESGGAITLRDSIDTQVSSCQLFDPVFRGVHLIKCERCRASGNTVVDRLPQTRMRSAIAVSGGGKDNLIDNNMVSRGKTGGVIIGENLGKSLNNTEIA
jgi:hypothetical protein